MGRKLSAQRLRFRRSTGALFAAIKESIVNCGLSEHAAQVAVYFLLSSWFVEILPVAPFLLISGPRAEASLLLALLSRLVRHPVLSRCHRRQDEADVVYVGDIAADAVAILTGRGETAKLEAREIGSILRDLGVNGKRNRRGYRFVLDDPFCHRIHKLAQQFDVATAQEGGLVTCPDCAETGLVSTVGA
jgi:hypothetical protein